MVRRKIADNSAGFVLSLPAHRRAGGDGPAGRGTDGAARQRLPRRRSGCAGGAGRTGARRRRPARRGRAARRASRAGAAGARSRARGWRGDDDLAEQLEAALGQGPSPLLRLLPVDLDELADLLEGDPADGGGRVDLRSGEVWPQAAVDYAREVGEEDPDDEEDPDRWLAVWCEGSREGYRDMQDFLGTVTDPGRADRLSIAMSGRGAFRRFKDVLARWPAELERWHGFAEERQRGRARAWLALVGYAPVRSRPLRG